MFFFVSVSPCLCSAETLHYSKPPLLHTDLSSCWLPGSLLFSWLKTSCPSQIWCNIPHSAHQNHGFKKKTLKKKKDDKKSLSSWFLLLGVEKPACSLEKGWRDKCAAHCSVKSLTDCLVSSGSNFHLVLFKAVCRDEPLTVFIPERESLHVQYSLSSDFDWRLWSVLRLYVSTLLLAFCLASWSDLSGVFKCP